MTQSLSLAHKFIICIHVYWGGFRVSKTICRRLSGLLAVPVGMVLLGGCSGEENIPLKKVDFVQDTPKDYKEKRKGFMEGSSAKIGHDPSGIAK